MSPDIGIAEQQEAYHLASDGDEGTFVSGQWEVTVPSTK